MSQLTLPLKLDDHAVFESYLADGNESVVAYLEQLAQTGQGPGAWLHGQPSTGKTHLLQAVCERIGDRAQYVPLQELHDAGPAIVDGLERRPYVCIDDVDAVASDDAWELGLFTLVNALNDAGGVLLATAASAPRDCGFALADLVSRFAHLSLFRLQTLDDQGRIGALQLRANQRGLELPPDTARFLLGRIRRDMSSLYEMLDRLDAESLKSQRRLTIPFVRDVLEVNPRRQA